MDKHLARAIGGQAGNNGLLFRSPETAAGDQFVSEAGYRDTTLILNSYLAPVGEPYSHFLAALHTVKHGLFSMILPTMIGAIAYALTGIPTFALLGLICCFLYARQDFERSCGRGQEQKKLRRYHAAEHKVINCLENGTAPTIDALRKQSRFNWRCGGMPIGLHLCLTILMIPVILISADAMRAALPGGPLYVVFFGGMIFDLCAVLTYAGGLLLRLPHYPVVSRSARFAFAPMMAYQCLTTAKPSEDDLRIAVLGIDQLIEQMHGQKFRAESA